jgi:pilus assembly protein CpaB
VLLFVLAGVAMIAAYSIISGYVSNVRGQVEPKVRVLALVADVPPYQTLPAQAVQYRELPRRWVPDTALSNPAELIGQVPATQLPKGSILQRGMLIPAPELEPGQREIAILVDARTGVAGKVTPGSIVDVYAAFSATDDSPDREEVVVPGARVIDVGQVVAPNAEEDGEGPSQAPQPSAAVPVTFALTPREALAISHAEAFSGGVRLALLRPGDDPEQDRGPRVFPRSARVTQ